MVGDATFEARLFRLSALSLAAAAVVVGAAVFTVLWYDK